MALVKDGTRVGEAVFLYSFYYVKKKKQKTKKSFPKAVSGMILCHCWCCQWPGTGREALRRWEAERGAGRAGNSQLGSLP